MSALTSGSQRRPFVLACAAEWTRLWTVRATWWCLLAGLVTMCGVAVAAGLDASREPVTFTAWRAGEITSLYGQFAPLLFVLLAVTSEFTTGSIGWTLQWTSRRHVLLAARVVVLVVVAALSGIALAAAATLAAWAAFPGLGLPLAEGLTSLSTIAGVVAAGALLSVGVGLLVRSTAGALATVFLLMLALPFLLPAFGLDWMTTTAGYLPGSAAAFLLLDESVQETTTGASVVVLLSWAAVALVAGGLRLLRDDAGG